MNPELVITLRAVGTALERGQLIPYLGAGLLPSDAPVPRSPEALAALMTAKVSVPHKIRGRLTAAAQFIENFKHRKTLVTLVNQAFAAPVVPSELQRWLAGLALPLVVDTWYDAAMRTALQARADWGEVQGLSQAEHFGNWYAWYDAAGAAGDAEWAAAWSTLLYKPIGAVAPAANYLVSDSDFVEVLTEIDIQTPIPAEVQQRRRGRSFLFLGCRFNDQLQRSFARQIMKRSSERHWAVLSGELTRNEERFLVEQGIVRIDLGLEAFTKLVCGQGEAGMARQPGTLHAPEQVAGSLAS